MASLDNAPKLCKGSFAVLLSDGYRPWIQCFRYVGSMVRDGTCSAYATLLVDLADGVSNMSPERDGDNRAVVTSFPPILLKHMQDAVKLRSCSHSFPFPPWESIRWVQHRHFGSGAQILAWLLYSRSTSQKLYALDEGHNWIPLRVGITVVAIPQAVRILEWPSYHLSRNNESWGRLYDTRSGEGRVSFRIDELDKLPLQLDWLTKQNHVQSYHTKHGATANDSFLQIPWWH
jgi:hypothetical protein